MPDPILIEDRLIAKLLACSAVTAIVGNRIRPGTLAQGDTFPAVTLTVELETPQTDLDDMGEDGQQTIETIVEVSALAKTHREARILQKAIQRNGTNPGTGLAGFSDSIIQSVTVLATVRELVDLKDDASGKLEVMRTRYQILSCE